MALVDILPLHQRRVAMVSIGPSTIRGLGPPGTIGVIRGFLEGLDLRPLASMTKAKFETWLEQSTEELRVQLPWGAQNFGTARKCLNIFLRDVLYSHALRTGHALHGLEPWLELPMDSHVAAALLKETDSQSLPKWKTIKGLEGDQHRQFQSFASQVARRRGVARVHLDLFFWRSES